MHLHYTLPHDVLAMLFVFRKPYTKAGSNQQEDCASTVNQTLLSVRTPGDVPQVRMLSLDRGCVVLCCQCSVKWKKVVSILELVCCFLLQL